VLCCACWKRLQMSPAGRLNLAQTRPRVRNYFPDPLVHSKMFAMRISRSNNFFSLPTGLFKGAMLTQDCVLRPTFSRPCGDSILMVGFFTQTLNPDLPHIKKHGLSRALGARRVGEWRSLRC